MNSKRFFLVVVGLALSLAILFMISQSAFAGVKHKDEITVTPIASGLSTFLLGSTVGPDGALYVPDGQEGMIWRVEPDTGDVSLFAGGLPKAVWRGDQGGPGDVAFVGDTAYAMVTLVASDIGGSDIVGIYRVDGPSSFTIIADIGQWSIDHPPDTPIFVETGAQFSMQAYRGGLLVVDGHHNRLLWVSVDGQISELVAFPDIVPTGTDIRGDKIYLAQAGPIPHDPSTGKVLALAPKSYTPTEVASGLRLLVDVEFHPGRSLYALSHGEWNGQFEGSPAFPNTGALARVNDDGTFTILVDHLNQPTSLEFIGNTAYVTLLSGSILKIENLPKL
jgi:sugar lactone lactonase YvrE